MLLLSDKINMKILINKKVNINDENYQKARFHYLLQILFGESLAINYSKTIANFAPTEESKNFLLRQQKEEESHLELLSDYVASIDRPKVTISKHMKGLHNIMERALEKKDYPASILVQNFIVEGLVIVLIEEMSKHGDDKLKELCDKIIKDEVFHVAFGVSELKKELLKNSKLNRKLSNIQRLALFRAVLSFTDLALEARYMGIAWDDLARKVVEDHLIRIKDAGLKIPFYDKLILRTAIWFFVIV